MREALLESEERKWEVPCYTLNGKNVAVLGAFIHFCSIGFFKGFLLIHSSGILKKPGDYSNTTRAIKCSSTEELTAKLPILKSLI